MNGCLMRVRKILEVEIPDLPKRLSEAKELSRKPLARICREAQITPVYWYKIVKGDQDSIPLDTLERLGQALDITFPDISF